MSDNDEQLGEDEPPTGEPAGAAEPDAAPVAGPAGLHVDPSGYDTVWGSQQPGSPRLLRGDAAPVGEPSDALSTSPSAEPGEPKEQPEQAEQPEPARLHVVPSEFDVIERGQDYDPEFGLVKLAETTSAASEPAEGSDSAVDEGPDAGAGERD